ncbi:MAG TPA: DUF4262 domain-containing protein [Sphingomonas sp.]|uniref:DUF4262 domain-containing protein n=1 Tax=Sphingomonas sp. TaxID=28214 RepID=UPI002BC053EB|nr:DUF4262 domain-containing protein [Sphingomonas sp.]HMI20176.1 DUF4262 domain-containing protein [Sphingomonas sp.]
MSVASLTAYEQSILDNIERTGCHITMVFDPEGQDPNFAYSVGFPDTVGQPEVIVFGLSNDMMGFMVNETLRLCRDGLRLADGTSIDGLLQGHLCVARKVAAENIDRDHFNSAMWYQRRRSGIEMSEAFQIVWPGARDGLFPWDAGCADSVREAQPPLYERRLNS